MQSDQVLKKVVESTYSYREIQKRVRVLKNYLISKLFSSSATLEEEVNSEMQWLSALGNDFYSQFNQQNIYQIFDEVEKRLLNISPITIYLAFEPQKEEIAKIGTWLRENTTTAQIYDFKIDYDLIGGCAIVMNGKYKDYSLRAKIKENTNEVNTIIRSSLVTRH